MNSAEQEVVILKQTALILKQIGVILEQTDAINKLMKTIEELDEDVEKFKAIDGLSDKQVRAIFGMGVMACIGIGYAIGYLVGVNL